MIPGVGKAMKDVDVSNDSFKHIEAIIKSMTLAERSNPALLNGNRRQRIAKGSGTNVQDVNKLLKQFEEMRKMTRAQVRKGTYSDEGYRYVPEIGVSIQGVDAGHAWEYSLRLAIHLKVPVKAEIEWRHNDKAAHPGERGVMIWTP